MNFANNIQGRIRLVTGLLLLIAVASTLTVAQRRNESTVVGTLIGVEVPEMGWPIEFEALKIFYLRVDKVEKGFLQDKYLRVAYGHNPSDRPSSVLPAEMFQNGGQWRFQLSSCDEFDSAVLVSRTTGDWVDNSKSTKVKGKELGLAGAEADKEFTSVPLIKTCVPIKGFEKEAILLENRGTIKGYWLDFENKKGYERVNSTNSTSPRI